MPNMSYYNGSAWVSLKNFWFYGLDFTWHKLQNLWEWNGSAWVKVYNAITITLSTTNFSLAKANSLTPTGPTGLNPFGMPVYTITNGQTPYSIAMTYKSGAAVMGSGGGSTGGVDNSYPSGGGLLYNKSDPASTGTTVVTLTVTDAGGNATSIDLTVNWT